MELRIEETENGYVRLIVKKGEEYEMWVECMKPLTEQSIEIMLRMLADKVRNRRIEK